MPPTLVLKVGGARGCMGSGDGLGGSKGGGRGDNFWSSSHAICSLWGKGAGEGHGRARRVKGGKGYSNLVGSTHALVRPHPERRNRSSWTLLVTSHAEVTESALRWTFLTDSLPEGRGGLWGECQRFPAPGSADLSLRTSFH